MVTYRSDLDVPSGAKGWADPRPWPDVEEAVSTALVWMLLQQVPTSGVHGFTLAYVPFSPLGGDAADLSWEVVDGPVGSTGTRVELAGHPAGAVEEFSRSLAEGTEGGVSLPVGLAADVFGAPASWRGWSPLLADASRLCCHLPPDQAGLELTVRHDRRASPDPWSWTVSIPVPGVEFPASEWVADSPGEALRAALDEADVWLQGLPAGHLRVPPGT